MIVAVAPDSRKYGHPVAKTHRLEKQIEVVEAVVVVVEEATNEEHSRRVVCVRQRTVCGEAMLLWQRTDAATLPMQQEKALAPRVGGEWAQNAH